MNIYRIYVKTHNKTGLKYLGYTKKNPYTYLGSGTYWRRHLKKHGNDVTTEVIHETTEKSEVTSVGLYYSNLWSVVDLKDQFGNKVWANLKSESGSGGAMSPESLAKAKSHQHPSTIKITCEHCGKTLGKPNYLKSHGDNCKLNPNSTHTVQDTSGNKNHNYNHTLYDFYHTETGEHVRSTMFDLRTQYQVPKTLIRDLVDGKIKYLADWQMSPVPTYKFYNATLNKTEEMTRIQFSKHYGVRRSIVGELVSGYAGRKSVNGWSILQEINTLL